MDYSTVSSRVMRALQYNVAASLLPHLVSGKAVHDLFCREDTTITQNSPQMVCMHDRATVDCFYPKRETIFWVPGHPASPFFAAYSICG